MDPDRRREIGVRRALAHGDREALRDLARVRAEVVEADDLAAGGLVDDNLGEGLLGGAAELARAVEIYDDVLALLDAAL